MRRRWKILLTAALAIQAGAGGGAAPPIERGTDSADARTAITLAQTPAAAQATILRTLRAAHGNRRYRMIIPFGTPLFPSDTDLAQSQPVQPALQRWLALSPEQRQADLLIVPDADYYWPADYVSAGRRLDFSTEFIIHLTPEGERNARLEVLQTQSKVRLGKKFVLLGRDGPGTYWDIRAVPASPQASAELLAFLAPALGQEQRQAQPK